MERYTLKDCLAQKLAKKNPNGIYECQRLGLCSSDSKQISGFHTFCKQGLLFEKNTVMKEGKP